MKSAFMAIAVLAGLAAPVTGRAEDDDAYLRRFGVVWRGGGTATLNLHLSPWKVSCELTPTKGLNKVRLSGSCRLKWLTILSKSIDAALTYHPDSDSYTGTYSVDGGPPAILAGRLHGDVLNLDVTWPILVNGHYKALITIVNDGRGHFALKTVDPLGLDGTPITTSALAFVPK
jgi:hypothetical protein